LFLEHVIANEDKNLDDSIAYKTGSQHRGHGIMVPFFALVVVSRGCISHLVPWCGSYTMNKILKQKQEGAQICTRD
jgi:hypothetical protein